MNSTAKGKRCIFIYSFPLPSASGHAVYMTYRYSARCLSYAFLVFFLLSAHNEDGKFVRNMKRSLTGLKSDR